jgi:serine/threonine protein kinase
MGVVYKAWDTKLGRWVALKVLTARRLALGDGARMLFREARAAARVAHASIAHVYEIAEEHDPPFVVMEYVKGRTLRQKLEAEALAPDEARILALAIASGLAAAHAAGVVHRDLKPDNVMVGDAGEVKLLDFGIARTLEVEGVDPDPASATLSVEGRIVGTPQYMSPEQAIGQRVDARSDVFSFGVLVYLMLTGESPFRRATQMETLIVVSRDEPRDILPDLPISTVVRKCLAKRPEERYPSGVELEAALRAPTQEATAFIPPAVEPLQPPIAKLLSANASSTPTRDRTIAVLPFHNAGDPSDNYLCDGLTEDLIDALSTTRHLRVCSRGLVMPFKNKREDPLELAASWAWRWWSTAQFVRAETPCGSRCASSAWPTASSSGPRATTEPLPMPSR